MLLYGCVMLGLTFSIAVAHHVALAAESPRFATLASSFQQLFAMGKGWGVGVGGRGGEATWGWRAATSPPPSSSCCRLRAGVRDL